MGPHGLLSSALAPISGHLNRFRIQRPLGEDVDVLVMKTCPVSPNTNDLKNRTTLQGINIYPTLGKGKSASKCHFLGDMLVFGFNPFEKY